jgi:hypothetical protein
MEVGIFSEKRKPYFVFSEKKFLVIEAGVYSTLGACEYLRLGIARKKPGRSFS